jgi:hypothetical protein
VQNDDYDLQTTQSPARRIAVPTVYLESTVVSYYVARPSRDLIVAAHQQVTVEWWAHVLPQLTPFVSQFVLEEISRGDPQAAKRRVEAVDGLPTLEMTSRVADLASEYYNAAQIPQSCRTDSYHIALAVYHGMDYLVTWNCTHIAGARVRNIVQRINQQHGFVSPIICTPEELMEV